MKTCCSLKSENVPHIKLMSLKSKSQLCQLNYSQYRLYQSCFTVSIKTTSQCLFIHEKRQSRLV